MTEHTPRLGGQEAMDWVDRQLSMDDDYRHKDNGPPEDLPPFITTLKNGGTKEEAIFALERMWEEQCGLRAEIEKLRGVPQEQLACDCGAPTEGEWADKHTAGCALRAEIDRLRNFSDKAMKEWQHALCREGKMIGRITSPISQSDSDS